MGKGEAFALLSAALWAYGVILYKRLGEDIAPLALNLQKNLIVLALVLPTWWIAVAGVGLMAGSVVMVKRVLEVEPLLPIVVLRLIGGVLGMALLIPASGKRFVLSELLPQRERLWLLLRAAAFGQYFSMLAWLAGY